LFEYRSHQLIDDLAQTPKRFLQVERFNSQTDAEKAELGQLSRADAEANIEEKERLRSVEIGSLLLSF
jgi:hypothetical protein